MRSIKIHMFRIDFAPVPSPVISVSSSHPQWLMIPILVVSNPAVYSLYVGMFVYYTVSPAEGRDGLLSALCLPARHRASQIIGAHQLGDEFNLILEILQSSQ